MNFLLHDFAERIRKSQHIETIVSHHFLIRLIVSYNLAQQQTSWEELIFAIEGGLALPAPNLVLERKRTTHTTNILQKRKLSARLRTSLATVENPQGSSSQLIELSSPENEQYLRLEGRDDLESEHEEETKHSSEEERNKIELPSTPNTSPPRDLLHDIELAQILANMNEFIQPKIPLKFNIGATQSEENFGHNKSIQENVICEVETGAEVTQEEVAQPGDIPLEECS